MEKQSDSTQKSSKQRRESSIKKKWVLIRPNNDGTKVKFFNGVVEIHTQYGEGQQATTTDFLAEAEIIEQSEETIKYMLNRMPCLARFEAVPVQDIDIFKAKLAGK